MAKPKIKRSDGKLIIRFWDEGPRDDTGSETDAGMLEIVLLLIIIWFIDKNTISFDPIEKVVTYSKKRILRRERILTYSFGDIKSLLKVQGRKKGHLEAQTTQGEFLLLTPSIKRRRLEKVTKMAAEVLDIEPQIRNLTKK